MLEAIDLAARGALVETPQDESLATYTAQVEKKDAVIDWTSSAAQIERMTRAYDPWPVARTRLGGDEVLIWRAAVEDESQWGGPPCPPPGTIVSMKPNPVVQCGTGRLKLIEVQAPGRKRMPAADFFAANAWKPVRDSADERRTDKGKGRRSSRRANRRRARVADGRGRDSAIASIRNPAMPTFCSVRDCPNLLPPTAA